MLAVLFSAKIGAPVDGQQHIEIVLAKYDESVEWANKYKDKATVTVYDKSSSPVPGAITLPNVGRESHTYLHHIISRYDSLADWTVFSQAGQPSFGCEPPPPPPPPPSSHPPG